METGDPVSLPVLNLRVNTGTKTAFIPAVLNLPVEDNFIGFWGKYRIGRKAERWKWNGWSWNLDVSGMS